MEYPILGLVDNDNMLYIFENDEHFNNTSIELFNQNIQRGVTYIDSEGVIHKVKNIINLGYKGFYGYSLMLKGRQIKIRTEFFPSSESISIEDLKKIVVDKINKKQSFWEESWNIDELKQEVNSAKTLKSLFQLLK